MTHRASGTLSHIRKPKRHSNIWSCSGPLDAVLVFLHRYHGCCIVIVIVVLIVQPSQASYCENNGLKTMDLNALPEEKLFPGTNGNGNGHQPDQLNCRWELSAPNKPTIAILSGFSSSESGVRIYRPKRSAAQFKQNNSIQYELIVAGESGRCKPYKIRGDVNSEDLFKPVQLAPGDKLVVTYMQQQKYTSLPPGLKIQLVQSPFCGSGMILFKRRCHRISRIPRVMMEEVTFINGDSHIVQLASFQSSLEIEEFVNENKQKLIRVGPKLHLQQPLDLSQPVRIGLFYNRKYRSISYLSKGNTSCQLKPVQQSAGFNFTDLPTSLSHACGSLRVDPVSSQWVIEFRDCHEPLPALISFSDEPSASAGCGNCSKPVIDWLLDVQDDGMISPQPELPMSTVVIAVVIAAAIIILAIISILAVVFIRRRIRRSEKTYSISQQTRENGMINECTHKPLL